MQVASLAALFVATAAVAQSVAPDALWFVENGRHLVQVMTGGTEIARLDLQPHGLVPTQIWPAPDGRIWLTTAPIGRIYLLDPAGPMLVTPVPPPPGAGSAVTMAFAPGGNAWVAFHDGTLQSFTSGGTPMLRTQVPIDPVAAAFDHLGMLWIGHGGGALTRVDPANGSALTMPLPLAANRRLLSLRAAPPVVFPNNAGFTLGGLWMTDDQDNILLADLAGAVQRSLWVGQGNRLTTPVIDAEGQVWVGTGHQVFGLRADGNGLVAGFRFPDGTIQGLDLDGRGTLLVRRQDPVTLRTTIDAVDRWSGNTLSRFELGLLTGADPARWHHGLVTDRSGDADGDGFDNLAEIRSGTGPFDPQSDPGRDLRLLGVPQIGGTLTFMTRRGPSLLALGTGLAASPLLLPGVAGHVRIDPATIGGTLVLDPITSTAFLPIPNQPALAGLALVAQALQFPTGAPMELTNAVDVRLMP